MFEALILTFQFTSVENLPGIGIHRLTTQRTLSLDAVTMARARAASSSMIRVACFCPAHYGQVVIGPYMSRCDH